MTDTTMITCKPYEAVISQSACNLRKKIALMDDGLKHRKCIECIGEEETMNKEIFKCKVCGTISEDGKKFFIKTQECKRCYDRRWKAEQKMKAEKPVIADNATSANISTPVTASLPVTKTKSNSHLLLLDFKDYPGWHDRLIKLSEEEMRTPMNMVMYLLKVVLKEREAPHG